MVTPAKPANIQPRTLLNQPPQARKGFVKPTEAFTDKVYKELGMITPLIGRLSNTTTPMIDIIGNKKIGLNL